MSIEDDGDRLDIVRTLASITEDDCTVRHPGGSFDAIFDEPSADAQFDDLAVKATGPSLTARTIDVQDIRKRTPLDVTRRGVVTRYYLEEQDPDGTGMSRVDLSTV